MNPQINLTTLFFFQLIHLTVLQYFNKLGGIT